MESSVPVVVPKITAKRPRVVVQTDQPVGELVEAVEQQYAKYSERLEHQAKCRALLTDAVGSGEFTKTEIKMIQTSLGKQHADIEPILYALVADIIEAQEACRRKQTAMDTVGTLLTA